MVQPEPAETIQNDPDRPDPGPSTADGRDLAGVTLGDFEVERLLGRGGMGEVYLARQISLNRPVALKVLRPDLAANEAYLKRFEAEATAAAKLSHPNIVHIYSLGVVDRARFIAMEYIAGTNLREYLVRKGALDLPSAFSIMRQAGVAVGAAGERGLVHRDIKPENLLLTKKGQVKVADFGLCRDPENDDLHLTRPGVTMGTPMYMSPEQVQGKKLDHRSDLYSLGVTYYHILAGQPPFRADGAFALAMKHVKETAPSLAVFRPDIPPALDRLVAKLMAKKPADRYQSAAEMLRDLVQVREAALASSPTLPAVTGELPSVSLDMPIPPALAPRPSRPSAVLPEAGGDADAESDPQAAGSTSPAPIRWGRLAATALVCLALGLGLGWAGRPAGVLANAPDRPPGPPGLWLASEWRFTPKKGNAEVQYRSAQVQAADPDRLEPWLAVPGHFPREAAPGAKADANWGTKAYVQAARILFRRRDAERLGALARDLAASPASPHQALAEVARAGADALAKDFQGALSKITAREAALSDPGMLELALEVAQYSDRACRAEGDQATAVRLVELERRLLMNLLTLVIDRDPLGRPGPN